MTLAAMPREHYARILEIGCSIGVITEKLAGRCDTLVGFGLAAAALERARARWREIAHVDCRLGQVPQIWLECSYDLIMLSEVVHYRDAGDVKRLVERVRGSLAEDGDVVLVHWTGETHYPLTGDEAADHFVARSNGFLRDDPPSRKEKYRIDFLCRRR